VTDTLAITLAQINPTVGDVVGNVEHVRQARREAAAQGADLVVCGELATAGYPPEDLVLMGAFQEHLEERVLGLAAETADGGPGILVGAPWRRGGALYNGALLLDGGAISAAAFKVELPNYGVFDERRIFTAGPQPAPIIFRGVALGVMVCEDMWYPETTRHLKEDGARILIVINGSPFELDKNGTRQDLARARIGESGLPLAYVNLIGGQDELVFDGASFVLGADGGPLVQAGLWEPQVVLTQWRRNGDDWACDAAPVGELYLAPVAEEIENVYRALVMGLGDYVTKNGFPGVLIGLSGGIDSALTAAVAVDALGPERVRCVMMPSPYTSMVSLEDAAAVARLLGAELECIEIGPSMKAFEEMLKPAFAGQDADVTEENIQARVRGVTLMALSNKFGSMVVSTGNKSELSVGYATLYGDMCGGFSVLKDVYKTMVFALARWRNAARPPGGLGPEGPVMPERVITKAPSAELKHDQTDQDFLPPYEELDAIVHGLIEGGMSAGEISAEGHDPALVERVWGMVDRAEYKRRQAPPGVKITHRAFGRDRRYPITNGFTAGR
jgi:NAD+ synthase